VRKKKYFEIYRGAAKHSLGIGILSDVALRSRFLLKTSASGKVSACGGVILVYAMALQMRVCW